MTIEEFSAYQEDIFDSFTKKVIRNISNDIHKEETAQADMETSLSELSPKEAAEFSTVDTYHLTDYETMRFELHGFPIEIGDPLLGQALFLLPPKRRDVVLLFYFADRNEPQIGKLLHITTMAVNVRHKKALATLREILEGLQHET